MQVRSAIDMLEVSVKRDIPLLRQRSLYFASVLDPLPAAPDELLAWYLTRCWASYRARHGLRIDVDVEVRLVGGEVGVSDLWRITTDNFEKAVRRAAAKQPPDPS